MRSETAFLLNEIYEKRNRQVVGCCNRSGGAAKLAPGQVPWPLRPKIRDRVCARRLRLACFRRGGSMGPAGGVGTVVAGAAPGEEIAAGEFFGRNGMRGSCNAQRGTEKHQSHRNASGPQPPLKPRRSMGLVMPVKGAGYVARSDPTTIRRSPPWWNSARSSRSPPVAALRNGCRVVRPRSLIERLYGTQPAGSLAACSAIAPGVVTHTLSNPGCFMSVCNACRTCASRNG